MLKKLSFLSIIILFTIIFIPNVFALSCSNKEASDLIAYASYVKAEYNVTDNSKRKTATIDGKRKNFIIPDFIFNITIYNITDNINIKVTNDVNNEELIIYAKDTEKNAYTFTNDDFGNVYTYTIEVRSNSRFCQNEFLKKIEIVKPKYNAYSELDECHDSNLNYCQKFITSNKKITMDDFSREVKEENEEPEKTNIIINFLSKYKARIIFTLILISIAVVLVTIVIVNKKIKERKGDWKL